MEHKPRNVYSHGATDGVAMGALLTLTFFVQALGLSSSPSLLMVGELMVLCIPVLAYIMLRRAYMQEGPGYTYSAIWMHGITMFICGCLIMGLAAYVYLRFINPTFISDMCNSIAEMYESLGTPEGDHLAHTFQNMISRHLLPSPIAFAFAMMWVGSFLGAILSMLLAAILKLFNHVAKRT